MIRNQVDFQAHEDHVIGHALAHLEAYDRAEVWSHVWSIYSSEGNQTTKTLQK